MQFWVQKKRTNIFIAIVFSIISSLAPLQASATSTILCSGNSYSSCTNLGYTDHGYSSVSQNSYWTMYAGHNCTNYAAYMAIKNGAAYPTVNLGNAHQWNDRAPQHMVNHTPAVGAIAQWEGYAGGSGAMGHVAYVEQVTSSYIIISEDNYSSGPFRWRKITTGSSSWPSNFIHFADVAPTVSQPATGPDDPKGNFENIQQVNGGVRLTGWALDPNTANPIAIHVYEGNCCTNPRGAYTADIPRQDVANAFPGNGNLHGFDIVLPLPVGVGGSKTYCAYAINVGAGSISPELGCRTVTFNWNPKGNFENIQQVNGGVRLTGWTLDPDTTQPIGVHVYEGNCCTNPRGAFTADISRSDVGIAQGYGDLHGFDITLPLPNGVTGSKTYCIYAINTGNGNSSPELGCRTVTFNWNPIGNYESIRRAPGGVKLAGWALDPDTTQPIAIHVYEGNCCTNPRGAFTANIARLDVGATLTYGDLHGFDIQIGAYPTSSTQKTYCIYAINTGNGNSSPELGCRTATISPDTEGNFESIEAINGGARLYGWALDPDVSASTNVHVYENGSLISSQTANINRPDVGYHWPDYGDSHGFDFTISLSPGAHNLCMYSVNDSSSAGISKSLGCRSVTVD